MNNDWSSIFSALSDMISTPKSRRSLIRTYVPDMITDGINQTKAHNLFKDYGFGIKQSDFAEIYNYYAKDNIFFDHLSSLSNNDKIDDIFMFRSNNLNDDRYRFVFNYSYYDNENQMFKLGTFSYGSKENMELGTIQSRVNEILKEFYGDIVSDLAATQLVRAYINDSFE